jgi:hypothetical protein
MKVGLIDADLLDNGTRHPNLALMKISSNKKTEGHSTRLLLSYDEIEDYDEIYVSKVFTFSKFPQEILRRPNVTYGGTGFLPEERPDLPEHIEHRMPDYHLYDEFVEREISRGIKRTRFLDYLEYSIGFATRGCFRKCSFCVNKKYNEVFRHAPISEFFDQSRKYLYLWDDNFLGYKKWREVLDEIKETGRYFQFRQGLDMRLMTEEKADAFANAKYKGDFIFAFDNLKDKDIIERNLKIWRNHVSKTTKLYLLCAYDSQGVEDIISVFERIKVLMKFRCLPYIMRYDTYKGSKFEGMYINLARWCNQPNFFKKKSFREYCVANGEKSSTMKYLNYFEREYPEVAKKYFDMKYEETPQAF